MNNMVELLENDVIVLDVFWWGYSFIKILFFIILKNEVCVCVGGYIVRVYVLRLEFNLYKLVFFFNVSFGIRIFVFLFLVLVVSVFVCRGFFVGFK